VSDVAEMTARSVTITIPMAPSHLLSPNQRSKRGGHWEREEATRELRQAAWFAGCDYVNECNRKLRGVSVLCVPMFFTVTIHEHVIWPKSKRGELPDPDSLATYCKAALDGIVDAGIIAGDSHKHIASVTTSQEKGTDKQGSIVITITESAVAHAAEGA